MCSLLYERGSGVLIQLLSPSTIGGSPVTATEDREDLVGQGISAFLKEGTVKREELYIQTKYTAIDGQDRKRPLPYDPDAPIAQQVEQSASTSLTNLGVEYLDSVVLHSPLKTPEETLEVYRALEGLHSRGIIRSIGVSNIYEAGDLRWLIKKATVPLGVVQNRAMAGTGRYMRSVKLITYATSASYLHDADDRSFWTLTGSPALLSHHSLVSLAEKHGWTPQQAVYKLCTLWNITPLCGSTTPAHVAAALDAVTGDSGLLAEDSDVEVVRRWLW